MTYAVLSSKAPTECINRLEALGFCVLTLPPFERLACPVDTHADMLFFHYNKYIVTHREYYIEARDVFDTLEKTCGMSVISADDEIKSSYPHDIAYNAILLCGSLFSNTKHTSSILLDMMKKENIPATNTKQGYAACSTLALSCDFVITADTSLCRAYQKRGIRVCMISNGSVSLPPYDCGFIGGASGVYGDTVYFAGDIDTHSDAEKIKNAITACGKRHVSLSKKPLCDIGGIKFFESNINNKPSL